MALKDVARTAVEMIVPPSPAELRLRLDQARQALVAAQQAAEATQAVLDGAYGSDDRQALLKAESDRAQARLALERAAGRVAALERQVQAADATQAADELEAGRRRLGGFKADRQRHGEQILAALDQLQAAVKAFSTTDDAILALPEAVRGSNAVPGHNLGAGALQAHLAVELAERRVIGEPSSMQRPRLADWLRVGGETLA